MENRYEFGTVTRARSATLLLGTAVSMLTLFFCSPVAMAQGWSWTPPASEVPAPVTAPAPVQQGSALYGAQGTVSPSAGYGGNLGMAPAGNTMFNQPWTQRWGTPYGGQNNPYQPFPAQPNVGQSPGMQGPQGQKKPVIDTKKKDDTKKDSKTAKTQPAPVITTGDIIKGFPRAASGDTLSFDGQIVHLDGIHAPDLGAVCREGLTTWKCGQDARTSLEQLLSSGETVCHVTSIQGSDVSAMCTLGNAVLAKIVVSNGMATTTNSQFVGDMKESQADGRGIWAK